MTALEVKVVNDFKISVDGDLDITYATAFNGKSLLSALKIKNEGARILTDLVIQVSVRALGQSLSDVWRAEVGTFGTEAIEFEDLNLDFSSELLFQQRDTVPAELLISISSREGVTAEAMWNLRLHSPDSWLWSDRSQEILAAYVQPNHPVLRQVLDDAVAILASRGQRVMLSGYQVPQHVRPIVEGIYQALVNLEITYSNPPSSWDLLGGQRIRNAQVVLEEKVGTCLDTAILFASLLEASGLNPVVAVIPGHAFVGYWTAKFYSEQPQIPGWTEITIAEVMNFVDSGYIELIETTTVCKGESVPYEEAIKESLARISLTAGLGVNATGSTLINISRCRRITPRPIRPMPAVYTKPDGTTQVIEYQPMEFNVKLIKEQMNAEGVGGTATSTVSLDVPPVVKKWLESLLDLSYRNPLINFKNPETCVPLLSAPEALGVIEDLLQNRQILQLLPNQLTSSNAAEEAYVLDDRGQVALGRKAGDFVAQALADKALLTKFGPDSHKTKMRKMASSAKTFFEETGSNGLYLAMGSLVWTAKIGNEERKVKSPLILLPVNIISKNRGREFYLTIDEGSQIMPNFSLAEKLWREQGIKLDNLVNLVEDESGVDIDGTFAYIRKKLADANLMDFRVDEDAVLGFFNFSTYRLWRDLLDNWKTFEKNALVNHFINTPFEEFKDPSTQIPDENLDDLVSRLPISSDASQARAISHAMAGKTFILQGPPGTGKSQTITNLLARALSEGKRVLFVAEKKDALDVVKERLDAAGLGAFSLDLHDKGMNPKVMKEQLANVLDIAIAADRVGYESARSEYEGALSPLQKYRNRLHEIGRLGESIYSALDKRLAIRGASTLPISGEFISESTIDSKERVLSAAKTLAEIGPLTGTYSSNPWSFATRFIDLSESDLSDLKKLTRSMRSSLETIEKNAGSLALIRGIKSFDELRLTQALVHKEAQLLLDTELNSRASIEAQRNSLQSLTALKELIDSTPFDLSRLDSLDVDSWIVKVNEANMAMALLRNFKLGGILKKINGILGTTVTVNKLDLLSVLEHLKTLKARKKYAEGDLQQIPGVRIDLTENFYQKSVVDEKLALLARLREITEFISESSIDQESLKILIKEVVTGAGDSLIQLARDTTEIFSILEATQRSISLWCADGTFGAIFKQTIGEWAVDGTEHSFSQLTRWIALMKEVQAFVEVKLDLAADELLSGKVDYIDAPSAFLDGYYAALVNNLVVERGFKTFEAMTINSHIRKLEDAHNEIRDRLPRITGAELLNRRGFDSSMRVGAIGDLIATLRQPKSRMPIRTLLARHWGVITKVTPCVLASPDSCVRFIDANLPPFDLVVFDEASQIRVANSIGAIGRSEAVIIVGDSKQMPPTSVAQVRASDSGTEEEEDQTDGLLSFDSESILDHCVTARVPDIMLNWHYRSADESLIAFSNKKYYMGKLNSFPSPSSDKSFKGLSFQYVEGGKFVRPENSKEKNRGPVGTNSEEIDAILEYLAKRLKDPKTRDDSIGIVTFNKAQRDEILDRLADSNNPDIQRALAEGVGGEEIFVKNLETVQGSERDVILFSVAFSKNLKGDLPLNFGPLTNSGGERRLNVAITRARKQVRIFCSFKPDELLNRKSSSTGVSHLAQYLKMANKEDEESASIYTTRESQPDRMRKEILAQLCAAGLNAVEEVGLSDFKVDIAIYDPKDSSKAIIGILLDGPRWNARETVSDRDCLSVTLLRDRMGWPTIERIWLASWIRNPHDEVARIVDIYQAILTSGVTPKPKREKKIESEPIYTSITSDDVQRGENPIDKLISSIEPWRPLTPAIFGSKDYLDNLYHPQVIERIQNIAMSLTDCEGPVSSEHFAKFVGTCFGFDRLVSTRVASINEVRLPSHQRDDEGFIYPKGETFFTFTKWRRADEGFSRAISEISLSEISNAMKSICEVAQGVRAEQVTREVARVFGVTKMSPAVTRRVELALAFAMSNGRLVQSDEYLQPS